MSQSVATPLGPDPTPEANPAVPILLRQAQDTEFHAEPLDPPLRWREVICLLALVVLSDFTIYRGAGFGGYAALFLAAALLLALGMARHRADQFVWFVVPMLFVVAARSIWCGSALSVAVGFALVLALSMSLAGQRPYVPEAVFFAAQTIASGYRGLTAYIRSIGSVLPPIRRTNWIAVFLPVLALALFSLLFTLANPVLLQSFRERLSWLMEQVPRWLIDFSPRFTELLFCLAAAWISAGLLRPLIARYLPGGPSDPAHRLEPSESAATTSSLFPAFRNTLIVVIVLFAAYLVFEFKTLWFRVFEKGFYYSGYAHEGAAWLTVALALATLMLSAIFRGQILHDARLTRLRRLAWLWSLENILLAVAVYHRMFIYVGFNGMTRMRTVGFYGMSAVVIGFFIVLWKIARNRDFVWLIRRHLWTLAVAIFFYSITPVDVLAMRYNVQRILDGDPAPCVQISVHPISSEGYLLLQPLLDSNDPTIREGIKAMLAQRLDQAEEQSERRRRDGWTAHQIADELLFEQLRAASNRWSEYSDRGKRDAQLKEFHKYAYQWF